MIKKNKIPSLLLIIPVLNSLASLTVNYFDEGTINPGTIRAVIIIFFLIYFFINHYKINTLNILVLLLVFYFLFCAMQSSNIPKSLYSYVKFFIAIMLLPVGTYYFNKLEHLLVLNKILIVCLSLYVLNLIISNIFQLGSSDYLEDSVYFGSARVNIAKVASILLLTTPVWFSLNKKEGNKTWRVITILIIFSGIILVLIAVKRSALLSLAIGATIYFLFSPFKKKNIRIIVVLIVMAVVSSTFYYETMLSRFEAREERFQFEDPDFERGEGRINEIKIVLNDFNKRNTYHIFFGTELFNDQEYYQLERMLHTDYMIFLHGTGVFGVLLYSFLFLFMFFIIFKYKQKLQKSFSDELFIVYISLLFCVLILAIGGTVYSVEILSIFFLYSGAIIGVFRSAYGEQNKNNLIPIPIS